MTILARTRTLDLTATLPIVEEVAARLGMSRGFSRERAAAAGESDPVEVDEDVAPGADDGAPPEPS